MWIGQQLLPHTVVYVIELAYRLQEPISISLLHRTIRELVRRHDILRTMFTADDSRQPWQHVLPWQKVESSLLDESALLVLDLDSLDWINGKPHLPPATLNIATGPLFRFVFFTSTSCKPSTSFSSSSSLSAPRSVLAIQIHHIITDGWSLKLLLDEMEEVYSSIATTDTVPPLPVPHSYIAHAVRQQTYLQESNDIDGKFQYWREQLKDLTPSSSLPPDKLRPPVPSTRAQSHHRTITVAGLSQFCSEHQVTEFMVMLACLQLALYLRGSCQEVTVGTAVANRNTQEESDMLGLFVNMLPIRTNFYRVTSFLHLLQRVKTNVLGAFDNCLPLEYLECALEPTHELYMQPLYQVMIVFQREEEQPLTNSRLFTPLPLYSATCECDMDVYVCLSQRNHNVLGVDIRYSEDLYHVDTIERFADLLEHTLLSVTVNSSIYIQSMLTNSFPSSLSSPCSSSSLPSLQSLPHSDEPAVQVSDVCLSWRELKSLAISAHLPEANIDASIAVVVLPLSSAAIALSLGKACIGMPTEVLDSAKLAQLPCSAVILEEEKRVIISQRNSTHPLKNMVGDGVGAFLSILHTYASQENLSQTAAVFVGDHSPLLALTHALLLHGYRVTVYDYSTLSNGHLQSQLSEDDPNLLACPADILPSLTTQLVSCPSIKVVLVYGLPSGLHHLAQWSRSVLPHATVVVAHSMLPQVLCVTHHLNLSTTHSLVRAQYSYLPIGHVLPVLQWRVVHIDGRTMPTGCVGAFVASSSDGIEYHSHCLVRQRHSDTIFELVSQDVQKHNTGEDSTLLLTVLSHNSDIVWCRLCDTDRLVYYTINTLTADQLSTYLKQYLAAHRVPSTIIRVAGIPVTASLHVDMSSIDRQLGSLHCEVVECSSASEDCRFVRETVMSAVSDLLGRSNVSEAHSFHSLGGHSLLVIQLASRLTQDLGIVVDVRSVFEASSLRQLIQTLHRHVLQTTATEPS